MKWAIYTYFLASVAIAGSTAFIAGWLAGFYAMATSVLYLVAGGGLKASLWWGDRTQKVGGSIFSVVLVCLAQWLSSGFSVHLFGYPLRGAAWGWIGFGICFAFADAKLAGMTDRSLATSIDALPPPKSEPASGNRSEVMGKEADDHGRALSQYQAPAVQGDANSQFRLGEAYSEGEEAPQSDTEAAKWWRMAAEQGHAAAQHSLGVAYCNGAGVRRDYLQAHMWLSLAAEAGHTEGHDRVFFNPSSEEVKEDLEGHMARSQLAEAQKLAGEWNLRRQTRA